MDLSILLAMVVSHLAVAVIAAGTFYLRTARALRASQARCFELEDELARAQTGLGELDRQFQHLEQQLVHTQRRMQSIHDSLVA